MLNSAETEMQGDVNWVDQSLATTENLAYVDGNGKIILRVDNTTNVPYNDKRDTVRLTDYVKKLPVYNLQVRITTTNSFPVGSVFLLDALHVPYGCSVWPGEVGTSHDFVFVISDGQFPPRQLSGRWVK
jgi:hypothetical protein